MGLNNMSYKPFFKETENWRDYKDEGEEGDTSKYSIGDMFKPEKGWDEDAFKIVGIIISNGRSTIYKVQVLPEKRVAQVLETQIDRWVEEGDWKYIPSGAEI